MKQHEEALTKHPRWAQEPGAYLADIERYAFSLVDPEERFKEGLPLLLLKDALDLLLDLAEGFRAAKDKITSAAQHAEYRKACRVFLDYGSDTPETFQAEADFLQALFCGVCRALGAYRFTFTGGELSQVKAGLPAEAAEALDKIKRAATLPDEERLTAEDTAALFEGLRSAGLVSGSLQAFAYHLGPLSTRQPEGVESALSWTGKLTLFAYFAQRLSCYKQQNGYTIRVEALCRAFSLDESARNTLRRALSYLRNREPKTDPLPPGSEAIDKLFQDLNGNP